MIKKLLLLGVTGLFLASCNIGGDPSTIVGESAQKRWDALISGNMKVAYNFYSDAYKKTVPYEHFINKVKGVGFWSKAKVLQVVCESAESSCEAEVKVTVAMRMRGLDKPVETSSTLTEKWTKNGSFSDWTYVN